MNSFSLRIIRVINNSVATFPHTPDLSIALGDVLTYPTSATQGGGDIFDSWKVTGVWYSRRPGSMSPVFIGWAARYIILFCGHSSQSLLVYKGKEVSLLASRQVKRK